MVSEQDIAMALESILLREWNPNNRSTTTTNSLTSLNAVVQHLESKLGLDLSHKIDFIRSHIHFLLLPPQLPPPPSDHFSLHQTPNFHSPPPNFVALHHRPDDFVFRPPPPTPQPLLKTEAFSTVGSAIAPPEAHKESAQPGKKRRGGPGGLNKLCGVSPELQTIVGQPKLPRTEIVKQLWAYIRKNNLQDPSNKRKIICNDELRLVFETDCTDMFKMNKLLAKHIISLEPTKQPGENSKKMKVEAESGSGSTESIPIVIISEALANFFGTSERELSQAEVSRRVWEYIKVNQLEDPLNSMAILCDAKLRELLGCESISALGIPEMLARHHLYKRS